MKKAAALIVGILLASMVYSQQGGNTQQLSVKVNNIKNKGKTLYLGIYRATDDFPEFGKFWKNLKVVTTTSETTLTFDVPFGDYAVAISHDINGNGKLDKNFFGYPSEPFGFSNNYRPKLSGPDFEDCKFSYTKQNNLISITLID